MRIDNVGEEEMQRWGRRSCGHDLTSGSSVPMKLPTLTEGIHKAKQSEGSKGDGGSRRRH